MSEHGRLFPLAVVARLRILISRAIALQDFFSVRSETDDSTSCNDTITISARDCSWSGAKENYVTRLAGERARQL